MHKVIRYTEEEFSCSWGNCKDLGYYGKDSPYKLIDKVVKHAGKKHEIEHYDAVLLLGDFPEHDLIPGEDNITMDLKFDILQEIWSNTTKLLKETFTDIPILSSFGNNDNMFNY